MTHVLIYPHGDSVKAAWFSPVIARASQHLSIQPLAWKNTDPLSHAGHVLELNEEEDVELTQFAGSVGCNLLPVVGDVAATLAAVGLQVIETAEAPE